jgi:hypothetical protein
MNQGSYSDQLKKCIKGTYGTWFLLHLPSGRWAAAWHQIIGAKPECREIMGEATWFYTKPEEKTSIAVDFVATGNAMESGWSARQLWPFLRSSHKTKEAKEELGCPPVQAMKSSAYRSMAFG